MFQGPHVEQVCLLMAILALLLSFPYSAADKGKYTKGEDQNDATDRYSNDSRNWQFIASPPVGVS